MGAKASTDSLSHPASCRCCEDCILKGFEDPIDQLFPFFVPFEPSQCTDPVLLRLFETSSTEACSFAQLISFVCENLDKMRHTDGGSTLSETDRKCWYIIIKISLMGAKELSLKQALALRQAVSTLRMSNGVAYQASLDFSANSMVMARSQWPKLFNADPYSIMRNDSQFEKHQINEVVAKSVGVLLRRGATCIRLPILQRAYIAFQCALPFLIPFNGHEAAFVRICSGIGSANPSDNKFLFAGVNSRIGPEGTAIILRLMATNKIKGNSSTSDLLASVLSNSLKFYSPEFLATLPLLKVMVTPLMTYTSLKILDALSMDRFLLASKVIWPQYQKQLQKEDDARQISLECLETLQNNFLKIILRGLSRTRDDEAKLRLLEQLVLWLPEGLGCRDVAFVWACKCTSIRLAYTLLQHLIQIDLFCVPPKKRGAKKVPKPLYAEDIGSLVLPEAELDLQCILVQLRNCSHAKDRIAKYKEVIRKMKEMIPGLSELEVNNITQRLSTRESIRKAIIDDIFMTCSIPGSNLEYLHPILLADLAGNQQPRRPAERTPAKRPSSSQMQSKPSKRGRVQPCPSTSANPPSCSQRTCVPHLDLDAGADLTEEVSGPSPQRAQANVKLSSTEKRKCNEKSDCGPPAKIPRIEADDTSADQGGPTESPQQPSQPVPVVQPAPSSASTDDLVAVTEPSKIDPPAKSANILRPAVLQWAKGSVQLSATKKRKCNEEPDCVPQAKIPRIGSDDAAADQGGPSVSPQLQAQPPLEQPSQSVPVVQPAPSSSSAVTEPSKIDPPAKSANILRPAVLQLPPSASTAGPSSAPDLLTMSAAPSPSMDRPLPDQDQDMPTSPSPQMAPSPSSSAGTATTPYKQRSIQLNLLRPVVVLEQLVLPDASANLATVAEPAQPEVRRSPRLALKVGAQSPATKPAAAPKKVQSNKGSKKPPRKVSQQTPKKKAPKRLKRVVVPAAAKVDSVSDLPEMAANESNLAGRPMRKAAYKGNMLMKFICNAETNLWQKRRQPNMSDFLPGKFFRNR